MSEKLYQPKLPNAELHDARIPPIGHQCLLLVKHLIVSVYNS